MTREERLLKALRTYGTHLYGCDLAVASRAHYPNHPREPASCTCGLYDVFDEPAAQPEHDAEVEVLAREAHDAGACSNGLGVCTTRDCDGAKAVHRAVQAGREPLLKRIEGLERAASEIVRINTERFDKLRVAQERIEELEDALRECNEHCIVGYREGNPIGCATGGEGCAVALRALQPLEAARDRIADAKAEGAREEREAIVRSTRAWAVNPEYGSVIEALATRIERGEL